ncbi:aminotransferase class V-fold PLP-dependent enzyme [uncultured Phascolarctobacterium sp.]|uniref:aminotransferase class V-fold PLP-dependent enzyme n=1 Tax=uncultured Phascolarctobacterium sp. TaxID=512296 RepID=UPI0025D5F791|nr:aminotransferase class V-fold PLP-dependent enzyme [uncultured Phascolarctobacterium sp.]
MQQIYLDNAATTFPKPQAVADAVYQYITQTGTNISRGTCAAAGENLVFTTREQLCRFFGGEDSKNVVFTKNITESLNIIIKGLLRSGEHVLVSAMEHNAVMRPLRQIGAELTFDNAPADAITFSRIPCNEEGALCLEALPQLVLPNTKAIIMTHASNVCGTVQPLAQVGSFCQEHGLRFIVDSAQTAGVLPIDMQAMHIDALAFTGHKGLLAPQGIGGFVLRESIIDAIAPLIVGGTGSLSHTEHTPRFMPDKFEAGTLNLPGIAGLNVSLTWLQQQGISKILTHELTLTQQFLDGLQHLEAQKLLRIIGKRDCSDRVGVVSVSTEQMDIAELAFILADKYGIATRVGLHCAPNAHKTLGTYPTGTLRFSFGWHNTAEEVNIALQALEEVLAHGL